MRLARKFCFSKTVVEVVKNEMQQKALSQFSKHFYRHVDENSKSNFYFDRKELERLKFFQNEKDTIDCGIQFPLNMQNKFFLQFPNIFHKTFSGERLQTEFLNDLEKDQYFAKYLLQKSSTCSSFPDWTQFLFFQNSEIKIYPTLDNANVNYEIHWGTDMKKNYLYEIFNYKFHEADLFRFIMNQNFHPYSPILEKKISFLIQKNTGSHDVQEIVMDWCEQQSQESESKTFWMQDFALVPTIDQPDIFFKIVCAIDTRKLNLKNLF